MSPGPLLPRCDELRHARPGSKKVEDEFEDEDELKEESRLRCSNRAKGWSLGLLYAGSRGSGSLPF
jgi:hypothetical protein